MGHPGERLPPRPCARMHVRLNLVQVWVVFLFHLWLSLSLSLSLPFALSLALYRSSYLSIYLSIYLPPSFCFHPFPIISWIIMFGREATMDHNLLIDFGNVKQLTTS